MQYEDQHNEVILKLGHRIKILRDLHGITQLELGQKIGHTNATSISTFETGTQSMSVRNLIKIASVLGVTPGALLDGGDVTVTHRVSL